MSDQPLLEVTDLRTYFHTGQGTVKAVDDVSFQVERGETLGLVGESGSGKSVTSLSILRLVAKPGKITGGRIAFEGQDLLGLSEARMRKIRGKKISMIFQEPMTSLNPVFTIGRQISEVLELHEGLTRRQSRERVVDMLRLVGIPMAERRVDEYPHQMSGGMRQRVMIAMALACRPKLLIADEPTTALDVTIQAQILELMKGLGRELGTSILLITHDLGVIAEMAKRVAVMYAGRIVEEADVVSIFRRPLHPYTQGLLESIPTLGAGRGRLYVIKGTVPNLAHLPQGCRFSPRCPVATDRCFREEPALVEVDPGHKVSCWLHTDQDAKGVAGA